MPQTLAEIREDLCVAGCPVSWESEAPAEPHVLFPRRIRPRAPPFGRARLPPSRGFFSPAASVHVPRPWEGEAPAEPQILFSRGIRPRAPPFGRARLPPSRAFTPTFLTPAVVCNRDLPAPRPFGRSSWRGGGCLDGSCCPARQEPRPPEGLTGSAGASTKQRQNLRPENQHAQPRVEDAATGNPHA